MKVFLLGRVAVETDGAAIDEASFPGRQGRLLFAYLAAEQGRAVPKDELAEVLWEQTLPPTWDKALSVIVSKLRRLLAEGGVNGANPLTSAFGCYRLDLPEGTWVDAIVAAKAVEEAEVALAAGNLEQAMTAASLAESLVRQPFLPGEDGSWVEEKRRELSDVRSRALSALADACLRSGDTHEATRWAGQAVALAPFSESGYRRLMEAHAAAGDRAEALRVYERCRRLLAEELGAFPSPETESIYRGLLAAAPSAPAKALKVPEPTPAEPAVRVAVKDQPESPRDRAPHGAGRRWLVVVLVCVAIAAVAAVTVVLVTRGAPRSSAAEVPAGSLGVFHLLDGRPAGQISLGSSPSAVVAAPEAIAVGNGAVWVTNPVTNSVSRIDPKTDTRSGTVAVGNNPTGAAVGAGFVWVANGLDGTVSKIDPNANGGNGAVVDRVQVGNGPSGVAFGGGRLWVANSIDRTVTAFLPGSRKPATRIPVPLGADAIAYRHGLVWVVSSSANSVSRIDAKTGTLLRPITVGNDPTAITTDSNAVWVVNSLRGTVSRIDPSTGSASAIVVGGSPTGIAAGHGTVWVGDSLAGTVSRIDPAAGKVVQTLHTSNPPTGLAVSGGTLYVAAGTPASAHRGGTLTVLTVGPVDSIDPAAAYSTSAWSTLITTNDGLVTFQRVGGSSGIRIVPDLATSLPLPGDGGKTYTFQVRPGIHYSTGALVQPADFRRAIERSLANGAGTGFYFTGIVGAAACTRQKARCDLRKGIVIDPVARTITFRLTAPDPDFLDKLALPAADAVPANTPLHAQLPLPATGPYRIAHVGEKKVLSHDPKTKKTTVSIVLSRVTLVRNQRFREWSPTAQPAGYPDRLVYKFDGSANNQIDAVKAGTADYAMATPAAAATLRRSGYSRQLHVNPDRFVFYFFLNTRLAPFNNLQVRRAINYAIDRNRLVPLAVAAHAQPMAQPTCQVLPPGVLGYARFCPYRFDPTRARRLVAASGTAGQTVTVWTGPPGVPAAAYLVSVLDSLGYKTQVKRFSSATAYTAALLGGRAQIGGLGWATDFPTPSDYFTELLTCAVVPPHGPNIAAFCNRKIDRMINRARSLELNDPATATVLWSKIDQQVVHQAPWALFANGAQADLVSRRVGNYQYNPQWGPLFDQMWVH